MPLAEFKGLGSLQESKALPRLRDGEISLASGEQGRAGFQMQKLFTVCVFMNILFFLCFGILRVLLLGVLEIGCGLPGRHQLIYQLGPEAHRHFIPQSLKFRFG